MSDLHTCEQCGELWSDYYPDEHFPCTEQSDVLTDQEILDLYDDDEWVPTGPVSWDEV